MWYTYYPNHRNKEKRKFFFLMKQFFFNKKKTPSFLVFCKSVGHSVRDI